MEDDTPEDQQQPDGGRPSRLQAPAAGGGQAGKAFLKGGALAFDIESGEDESTAVVTDARGGSSGGGSSAGSSEDEGEDEEEGSGDGMAETLRRGNSPATVVGNGHRGASCLPGLRTRLLSVSRMSMYACGHMPRIKQPCPCVNGGSLSVHVCTRRASHPHNHPPPHPPITTQTPK